MMNGGVMSKRRSYWIPVSGRNYPSGIESHLLYQDVSNAAVPYRSGRQDAYRLIVDPVDLKWAIDESLALSSKGRGTDTFIRDLIRQLFADHEVWIEVATDLEPGGRSLGGRRQRVFEVAIVHSLHVDPETGRKTQILPQPSEIDALYSIDYGGLSEVDLTDAHLVKVELPPAYPADCLDGVLTGLTRIPEKLTPDWLDRSWLGLEPDAPAFDVGEHIRLRDLQKLQATAPIGWTAKDLYKSERRLNEYAYYERELRFLHFRTSLRMQAESGLVAVLQEASAALDFSVELYADGLVTPEQVDRKLDEFRAGNLPFAQVHDWLFEQGTVLGMEARRLL